MDYKKQVLTGLVLTAFFSSLAVFDLIPGWIMAILFSGAGIALTYYYVLSRMRLDSLADKSTLLKGVKEIGEEKEMTEICQQLGRWSQRLVQSQAALVYWQGEWIFKDEEFTAWAGLKTAQEWVREQKGMLILNKNERELFSHPWPENIDSLLALPITVGDEVAGILFLLNEKERGYFTPQDGEMPKVLCQQAAMVLNRTCEYRDLEDFSRKILTSVVNALDALFPGFAGHSQRVTRTAVLVGQKMGLNEEELRILEYAGLLHDIGKMFVPPEELPGEEGELEETEGEGVAPPMEEHPLLGAQILPAEGVYARIQQGILYHHERYDGSGYPQGLSHMEIPLTARIIAVADLYDALTHLAPEEDRLDARKAIAEMKKNMGTLLDPLVVVVLEEVAVNNGAY